LAIFCFKNRGPLIHGSDPSDDDIQLADISDEIVSFYDKQSNSLLNFFFPTFCLKIEGVSYSQRSLKHGKIR